MDKVLQFITPAVLKVQMLSARIGEINRTWLIVAICIIVIGVIVFFFEKSKATLILLGVYAVGFVLLQIPPIADEIKKSVTDTDFRYVQIALGIMPIVALGVQKFKKKRSSGSSSIYSSSRPSRH